jgi:hypothetical protein
MADINFFIYETTGQPFTEKFAAGISTDPTVTSGSMYIKNEDDPSNVLYYGTITVGASGNQVQNEIPTSITITEVATPNQTTVTWTPDSTNGFRLYDDTDGNGNEYMSWRTDNSGSQYLTSGHSLDVWSPSFYTQIIDNNKTWTELEDDGPFSLNTEKYTISYYYDGPTALHWSKGGKIGFTNV